MYEFQIDRVGEVREFRPLRFEEFQAPAARIHNEINFAGSIPPEVETARASGAAFATPKLREDERLPDGACCRRLPKSFLEADIQQSAEQAGIRNVEFWALDDGLGSIREPWLKQHNLAGSLQHDSH